jgi:hypothetical protein
MQWKRRWGEIICQFTFCMILFFILRLENGPIFYKKNRENDKLMNLQ